MKLLNVCALALVAITLGTTALAKPPEDKANAQGSVQAGNPGKGNGGAKAGKTGGSQHNGSSSQHGAPWEDRNGDGRVDVDLGYLRGFVRDNHYNTGYQSLPPGIRKNLARGKPIPPGLQSRVVPGPMLAHLPYRDGYEWRVYGTDLVLVALATGLAEEVLEEIFD